MSKSAPAKPKGGVRFDNPVFDMAPFALPSVFWKPAYTRGSLWLEHLPFCFWAVEAARPKSIVTTGTADGVPYFALCEAVARLQLETRCVSLLRERPAGAELAAYNNDHFGSFSCIHGPAKAEAMADLPADIDLLVLADRAANEDGRVAQDWAGWLPKLSDRAVVLLSNVEAGTGAGALWKRLRRAYPHFHFPHGGGLGVAGVGRELPELLRYLLTMDDSRYAELVRVMFNRLGLAIAESYRLGVVRRKVRHAEHQAKDLNWKLASMSEQYGVAQCRVNELEGKLEASTHRLKLVSEHAKRVANAMEVLKRDHEQRGLELEQASRKLVKLKAEGAAASADAQALIQRAEQRIQGIKGEAAGLRKKLKREQESLQQVERELGVVLGSRSWALTSPLRWISRKVGGGQ